MCTHSHDPKLCPHVHTLTRSQTLSSCTHTYMIPNFVRMYTHSHDLKLCPHVYKLRRTQNFLYIYTQLHDPKLTHSKRNTLCQHVHILTRFQTQSTRTRLSRSKTLSTPTHSHMIPNSVYLYTHSHDPKLCPHVHTLTLS